MTSSQNQALVEIKHAIASKKNISSLLQVLVGVLRTVIPFDFIYLLLVDPATHKASLILPQTIPASFLDKVQFAKPQFEHGQSWFEDGPSWDVWSKQEPCVCTRHENDSDWTAWFNRCTDEDAKRYPKHARQNNGLRSWCIVPLTGTHSSLGTLELFSRSPNAFTEQEVSFIKQVALQVAIAVEKMQNVEGAIKSKDNLCMLLEVMNVMVSGRDLKDMISHISAVLHRVVHAEYVALHLYDKAQHLLQLETAYFPVEKGSISPSETDAVKTFPWDSVRNALIHQKPFVADNELLNTLAANYPFFASMVAEGLQRVCIVPLFVSLRGIFGVLTVGYRKKENFGDYDLNLLQEIAEQLSIAADNALAYQELSQLKDKLASEKFYLEDEIRVVHNFEEIIGGSDALKQVLAAAEIVAPTDSTVLILGETGTGKELVARAIHNLSTRRDSALVKLNCAAVPSELLESELFGHVKGAYTGAVSQRMGRLELAHQGTLFLDEIGELSIELQPKLLRVLQDRQFEPLGGNRVIHSDFRLIAATNRNLEAMVADRRFRSDLFYRLSVFPIVVPPLRERREDIPVLVSHFVRKFARKMGRKISSIPTEVMYSLTQKDWPGNIRELENFIERAVILSTGPELKVGLDPLKKAVKPLPETSAPQKRPIPIHEDSETLERERILKALVESNGIVSGPDGAAGRLGFSPSTLLAQMQHMASLEDINPGPQLIPEPRKSESSGITIDAAGGRYDEYDKLPNYTVGRSASEHATYSPDDLQAVEREHIIRILHETNWVIGGEKGAATRLGMKRTTLITRMARLGISHNNLQHANTDSLTYG